MSGQIDRLNRTLHPSPVKYVWPTYEHFVATAGYPRALPSQPSTRVRTGCNEWAAATDLDDRSDFGTSLLGRGNRRADRVQGFGQPLDARITRQQLPRRRQCVASFVQTPRVELAFA